MKIAVIGATGMIGSRVVAEAASRGHDVTAVSRSGQVTATEHVTPLAVDATAPGVAAELAAKHDAIVYAAGPSRTSEADRNTFVDGLTAFAQSAAGSYLIVIGGAGSLLVAPDTRLVDLAEFPDAYKPEALTHAEALVSLRALSEAGTLGAWTYLSPAPEIGPGERTGSYRSGWTTPSETASQPRIWRSRSSTNWRSPRTRVAGSPSPTNPHTELYNHRLRCTFEA